MTGIHSNSDQEDLYVILELDRNCSDNDIKKAYKRLALKYHPDKCGGDSTKFKKINNAYQILSDPEKRKQYDYTNLNLYKMIIQKIIDIISNITKNKTPNIYKEPEIKLKIPVTIKEIYHKEIKKITIKVKRWVDQKFIEKKVNLYLSLLNYQDEYVYKNQGDDYYESNILKRSNGILILDIKEENIRRDKLFSKYDLHIDRDISLYQVYFGLNDEFDVFNKKIEIKVDSSTILDYIKTSSNFSYMKILKNEGLPFYENQEEKHGDLFVFYSIKLPKLINNVELENFLLTYFNG